MDSWSSYWYEGSVGIYHISIYLIEVVSLRCWQDQRRRGADDECEVRYFYIHILELLSQCVVEISESEELSEASYGDGCILNAYPTWRSTSTLAKVQN